jgi:hypothetical protein
MDHRLSIYVWCELRAGSDFFGGFVVAVFVMKVEILGIIA